MITADQALARVVDLARALPARGFAPEDALGLVLAESVTSDRDYPPFDRATMDGFAVQTGHAGRRVAIGGEVRPGAASTITVDDMVCLEIMTGAPIPRGARAVVRKEDVARHGAMADLPETIADGQNIVRRGAEARHADVVVPAGARVHPIASALLAFVGVRTVTAHPLPSLAILVTGDEVVRGRSPRNHEIRDSNGPMLAAMAHAVGVGKVHSTRVRDTLDDLAQALAATRDADVVVLTGGVSAGNHDLVPGAVEAHGGSVVFHRVNQQPGMPLLFAVRAAQLIFGLPGTPLGAHLGFHRYVAAALRVLAGRGASPASGLGRLSVPWATPSDRRQFVLASVEQTPDGAWTITPVRPRGSSDIFATWTANAYIAVPPGTSALAPGDRVPFEWLPSSTWHG